MKSGLKAVLALAAGMLAARGQAQTPTDPQIVGIVVAANQIDIDHAKLALSHTQKKQVREFAQQMNRAYSGAEVGLRPRCEVACYPG
jgi:putative membrane protein